MAPPPGGSPRASPRCSQRPSCSRDRSHGVSYYVRYFADGVVTLKAIGGGLVRVDPQFKIDGGDLRRGKELLGEIEINATGSGLFAEGLATKVSALERLGTPAAAQVIARLRRTSSIVTLQVLDGERDPNVTWEMIGPL